jgi:hypothetical protein
VRRGRGKEEGEGTYDADTTVTRPAHGQCRSLTSSESEE